MHVLLWLLSVKDLEVLDGTYSDTVNMADFWEDIEKCEIAHGILPPGRPLFLYIHCFYCMVPLWLFWMTVQIPYVTRVTLNYTVLLLFTGLPLAVICS